MHCTYTPLQAAHCQGGFPLAGSIDHVARNKKKHTLKAVALALRYRCTIHPVWIQLKSRKADVKPETGFPRREVYPLTTSRHYSRGLPAIKAPRQVSH